jgi:LemA protein
MGKGVKILLGAVAIVVVLAGVWYNRLVSQREEIKASWSQVENVMQRRYDLIPNLVNTVKGYAKHEKKLLSDIAKLRSQWSAAKDPAGRAKASTGLEGALARLMVVVENYPTLKANENFLKLQDELAGTENRISVERMRYVSAVKGYNIAVQYFPGNLIAGALGFTRVDSYYESEPEAKKAPKVEF